MQEVRLGLIGFGNVGQGLAQILRDHGTEYERRFGLRFLIVAIADLRGNAYNPLGFDPGLLLDTVASCGTLKGLPGEQPTWDALTMIRESDTDAILELSFTDLQTGEPANTHLRQALALKKHVVTTNKGPVALYFDQLEALARQNGAQIGVEGTVMSGTPTLRLGRELLAGAGIQRVQGILNGTTNFILTQMETGRSYAEALAEAQRLGYAEADPSGDVEGYDTACKVVILARLLMGAQIGLEDVARQGITHLKPQDIAAAQSAGQRWKLLGTLEQSQGRVQASVRPEWLPLSHPLAGVSGATNAVTFSTALLGDVTLIGPGAGRLATGYAVIQDLLGIYR